MKNANPLQLYFISLLCFVLANLVKDKYDFVYGFLLFMGVVAFVIGIYRKFSAK